MAFLITEQKCCDACNGAGVVSNQDWIDYCEWSKKRMEQLDIDNINVFDKENHAELVEWWAKRGYRVSFVTHTGEWEHSGFPPEEITCHECEGAGNLKREVTLAEALIELGFVIPPSKARFER